MAAVGEVAALSELLAREPRLGEHAGRPYAWEPLLYLAYGRLDDNPQPDESRRGPAAAGARADPDAGYLWEGLPSPFTALTGAFGEGEDGRNQPPHQHSLALARLLLEAGADPNDSQTLYNRHFNPATTTWRCSSSTASGRARAAPGMRASARTSTPARWSRIN